MPTCEKCLYRASLTCRRFNCQINYGFSNFENACPDYSTIIKPDFFDRLKILKCSTIEMIQQIQRFYEDGEI